MRIRNLKNTEEIIENCPYLIKDYQKIKNHTKEIFNNNNEIHLEIGMGKGNFLIDMAKKHPDINFIGLELYTSVIARAAKKLENLDLPNLKIINCNALELSDIFNHEIDLIYLNFSDPWPKKRTENRRLTSEKFLSIYDNIFKNKKIILQKTDNTILFESSIISLTNHGYRITDISLDLWSTDKAYSMTEYEEKFHKQGIKILYLKAEKN